MKTTVLLDVGKDLLVVMDAFCSLEIQVEGTSEVFVVKCDADHKIEIVQIEDSNANEMNEVIRRP